MPPRAFTTAIGEAAALAEWIADRENRVASGSERKRRRTRRTDPEDGMSTRTLRRLEEDLRGECSATKRAQSDRIARRLRCLANATGLNRTDLLILELLLRYRTQPTIESMVDDVFGLNGRHLNPLNLKGPALPMLLGVSANTVHRRFRNDAPLVRSGLVSIDNDGDLDIVNRLHRLSTVPGDASLDIHHLLLGAASASELEWSDFDHVAADRDHVEGLDRRSQDPRTSPNLTFCLPKGVWKFRN